MTVARAEAMMALAILEDIPSRGSYPIMSYLSKKSPSIILSTTCEQIILF